MHGYTANLACLSHPKQCWYQSLTPSLTGCWVGGGCNMVVRPAAFSGAWFPCRSKIKSQEDQGSRSSAITLKMVCKAQLRRTQVELGRIVKEQQEPISPNHVQAILRCSVVLNCSHRYFLFLLRAKQALEGMFHIKGGNSYNDVVKRRYPSSSLIRMQYRLLLSLAPKYLYGKQIYGDIYFQHPKSWDPAEDPVAAFY